MMEQARMHPVYAKRPLNRNSANSDDPDKIPQNAPSICHFASENNFENFPSYLHQCI